MPIKATDYDKKTPREHILTRPDTYIGDIEESKETLWTLKIKDSDNSNLDFIMKKKKIKFVPGLLKLFDEIIVNSRDHSVIDSTCDTIKVDINIEDNYITIMNNGNNGIPVEIHPKFKKLVPSMIFGELLTSSNYDDSKKRTTGGRNGYGSKLVNVFSKKFTVRVGDPNNKKLFEQTWTENMSIPGKEIIKKYSKKNGFTEVTFYPDLEKFGIKSLGDHYELFAKRCVDICGSSKKLKVYFNGKKIDIPDFKTYVNCYYPKENFIIHDKNDRWHVAVGFLPEKGDEYISNVNGISTYLGGTHVNHVVESLVGKLKNEFILKKNKNLRVNNSSIKQHLVFFINAVIENPAFASQTKNSLTSKTNKFGSKYEVNDTFIKKISKTGIVEQVVEFAKLKAKAGLSKNDGKKQIKLRGIPKLEDANRAGGKESYKCSLILTEGDSAKTFAMSGLAITGRDYYGVFPLKGKLLNVREASANKLKDNAEITNLVKILGLKFNTDYGNDNNFNSIRYGKIICLTDQDVDGSHIKGLLINMFHSLWPSLLKRDGFMTSLSTPIVKAFKGKTEKIFYNLSDYDTWKENEGKITSWKIKYYKGLGTSTSREAKDYFVNIDNKLVHYFFNSAVEGIHPKPKKLEEDDNAITLAFEKSRADDRKEWLKHYNKDNVITYEEKKVQYKDFINRELIHFSNDDVSRSIPSMIDGLKPSQRKILYGAIMRGLDKDEVKVAQLAGFVSDKAHYHHGEDSLNKAIVGMAQDYVGSNNINILKPNGQFGTLLDNGKDFASPRYIWTKLEDLTSIIFNKMDGPVLEKQFEDGFEIEPFCYAPIIPMILVNGANGIGTGYSTTIPGHNPIDIIENLQIILNNKKNNTNKKIKKLRPYYNGFEGTIVKDSKKKYISKGVYRIEKNNLIITALPIGRSINKFKEDLEKMLEKELNKKNKKKVNFTNFSDNNTDKKVHFEIHFKPGKLDNIKDIEKQFKLTENINLTNINAYDNKHVIRTYDNVKQIMDEFFEYRLNIYHKRKEYMLQLLHGQLTKLNYKVKFILMKLKKEIKIENKKKVDLVKKLTKLAFPEIDGGYDYLLGMPLWNLTFEKVEELKRQRNLKQIEHDNLSAKSIENIWLSELDLLKEKYLQWREAKQKEDDTFITKKSKKSRKKSKKSKLIVV
tara:strand:+ start:43 stop:3522 length:3480 start_codon:yes stop_codon:yes gene_type:complete